MDYFSLPLIEQLLPILIPVAVAGLVKLFKGHRVPKWVVPTVIVPALGIVGQSVSAQIAAGEMDPVRGLVLAGLAIAIREVTNKIRKAGQSVYEGDKVDKMGERWP